jgi:hypothetical protein
LSPRKQGQRGIEDRPPQEILVQRQHRPCPRTR